MSNKKSSNVQAYFTVGIIVVLYVVSLLIYTQVLGNPANFENNDPVKGHPLNTFGIVHKGGFIVPILMAINLIVIAFTIERMITLMKAKGSGNVSNFVRNINIAILNRS